MWHRFVTLRLPRHHPRFREWVAAPESACLLDGGPGAWMRSLSLERSIDAAHQLHHDECLMTSNLNILDKYVLPGDGNKILELTLGQHDFPSAAVASTAPISRVHQASVQMEAMGLWHPSLDLVDGP